MTHLATDEWRVLCECGQKVVALRKLAESTFHGVWQTLPLYEKARLMQCGVSVDPMLANFYALEAALKEIRVEFEPSKQEALPLECA